MTNLVRLKTLIVTLIALAAATAFVSPRTARSAAPSRPNLVFIFTDDQRYDAMGCAGNPIIQTPNIDSLAERGVRFTNAFVTLSICSPSRAAVLTGRYGSATGVTSLGRPMHRDEKTFAQYLKAAGYRAGFIGKWHLPSHTPPECGFDEAMWFMANGPHYNRRVIEDGKQVVAAGFIEDYAAARAIRFVESAVKHKKPFVLHWCTQIPHMDHEFDWKPRPEMLARYPRQKMPVPVRLRELQSSIGFAVYRIIES